MHALFCPFAAVQKLLKSVKTDLQSHVHCYVLGTTAFIFR